MVHQLLISNLQLVVVFNALRLKVNGNKYPEKILSRSLLKIRNYGDTTTCNKVWTMVKRGINNHQYNQKVYEKQA